MTPESQWTLDVSGIEWPELSNSIPFLANVIELAVCAFMSRLRVKGRTESWKAHERNQQYAKNACCMDYANTQSLKWDLWLSKSEFTTRSTTNYGCSDTMTFNTGVVWETLPITRIHPKGAQQSKIPWLPHTLHNPGWMNHRHITCANFMTIQVLDSEDVEKAYGYPASSDHCLQWHVRWYGWRYASFSWQDNRMEGSLILCHEVCATETVQILCRSHSNNGYASHFSIYL